MEHKKQQMDDFYGVCPGMENISHFVNQQMEIMSKERMEQSVWQFGLLPVETYLDKAEYGNGAVSEDIAGFIGYFDACLVHLSGGKRSGLKELGERLIGKMGDVFSMRLMRMYIISVYFGKRLGMDFRL